MVEQNHPPIAETEAAPDAWITTQLIAPSPSIAWAGFLLGTGLEVKAVAVPVAYVAVQHLRSELEGDEGDEGEPIEDVESRIVPVIFDDAAPPRPLVLEPGTPGWCALAGTKEAALSVAEVLIRRRRPVAVPMPGVTPPLASPTAPDEGEKKGPPA